MSPPIHPPTRKLLTAVALATAPLVIVTACSDSGSGGGVTAIAGDGGNDDGSLQVGGGMGTLAMDGGSPDDGAVIMVGTVVVDAGSLLDAGNDAADGS